MRSFITILGYSLFGFGLALICYIIISYGYWILLTPKAAVQGSYLDLLISSSNLNNYILGLSDRRSSNKGLPSKNIYLSVPSLGLDKAKVTTNVNSSKEDVYIPVLKDSIAHYEGTALPGDEGNIFLYGHSVLPQFFDKNNYLTIFSNLDKVSIGDEAYINRDNYNYRYIVFEKRVIDPSQVEFLKPYQYNTLTLMTCVPPGMTTKRLLVIAREVI